jgi:hypothetical protein
MSSKISVTIIKARSVDTVSDLNKMVVHLEQILTEKEGIEVKSRQSITETTIKSSDFIVFAGWDLSLLSHLFNVLALLEKQEIEDDKRIFLFDEAGSNCWDDVNRLMTAGMDLGRIDYKLFNKIENCWNYRDIISFIDVKLRKLEINANPGDPGIK